MNENNNIDYAISLLSPGIRSVLSVLSDEIKNSTYEIRLRADKPVTLFGRYGTVFVNRDALCSSKPFEKNLIISQGELKDCFNRICEFSVHTHQEDINNGFVTTKHGDRVGICGTAVCENGRVRNVKDITSLNIRISKEILGCADEIISRLNYESVIIAGPPNSGKTTVLRDLIRQLSGGKNGRFTKIAVIDERREISGKSNSIISNDLGVSSDVLCSYPKAEAIDIAVRTLSPEYIVCDEISTYKEIESIRNAVNCGVKFIVTVHASDTDEILHRRQIKELIETYSFSKLILLDCKDNIGRIKAEYDIGELRNEIYRCSIGFDSLLNDGG